MYSWFTFFEIFQGSSHSFVKCEELSPMQILESEHDDVQQQHLRLDEPSKIDSDSSDEKGLAIDEDIINDDADTNIIEQTQVNDFPP